MADFERAVAKVILNEGGLSNDPLDRGGATAYGISAVSHPEVADKIKSGDFTRADADALYLMEYWNKVAGAIIADQWIAEEILDCAVNQGVSFASRAIQYCLATLGAPIVVDGVIGPKTAAQINSYRYPDALLTLFRYYRVERYLNIIKEDPTQSRFLAGWLRRV